MMAYAEMEHAADPKDAIAEAIGDLSGFEIFQNQVLVAVYQRPEKTKSGLILSSHTRDEDRYQSKVGLVLKFGPQAFVSTPSWHFENTVNDGDWVVYRPSDGWSVTIHGVLCRVLTDVAIKGRVTNPDLVW